MILLFHYPFCFVSFFLFQGPEPAPNLAEKSEFSILLIIGFALAAFFVLIINVAFIVWLIVKKRRKGKQTI
jgi:hypothetical protein